MPMSLRRRVSCAPSVHMEGRAMHRLAISMPRPFTSLRLSTRPFLRARVNVYIVRARRRLYNSRVEDSAAQQRLFLDVLSANATKRDAKQYLATFGHQTGPSETGAVIRQSAMLKQLTTTPISGTDLLDRRGVPTGLPHVAEQGTLTRTQSDPVSQTEESTFERIHSALVCFRSPEDVDDITLDGFAVTLSQLNKLGLRTIVVLDPSLPQHLSSNEEKIKAAREVFSNQAQRLGQAIERHSPLGAQSITSLLEWAGLPPDNEGTTTLTVAAPDLILHPLKRGVIPIVPCMAYTTSGRLLHAPSADVMAALTVGVSASSTSQSKIPHQSNPDAMQIERVIVLDDIGGIPNRDRGGNRGHVFINLEAEFDRIRQDLVTTATQTKKLESMDDIVCEQHLKNLDMVRRCLGLLPSSTSGLIITPQEAANASRALLADGSPTKTGSRRQQNALIHNLLTNRPSVSSSLPAARLTSASTSGSDASKLAPRAATLIKRGMPLQTIPDAERTQGWQKPADGYTTLSLEDDPRIDFPRLVHLINNSFRRKLAVDAYLRRIQGRIAGIIIIGEYEGGATLTWEMPPGTQDPARLVPYLDKFAVLQSSQGSSGVADLLFQTMVSTCFPKGVCWRSKKSNPVNKWYFERSSGSWRIPASDWTMFWTGDAFAADRRWEDYLGVCKSIQPTWEDSK